MRVSAWAEEHDIVVLVPLPLTREGRFVPWHFASFDCNAAIRSLSERSGHSHAPTASRVLTCHHGRRPQENLLCRSGRKHLSVHRRTPPNAPTASPGACPCGGGGASSRHTANSVTFTGRRDRACSQRPRTFVGAPSDATCGNIVGPERNCCLQRSSG
jgi:hypothetical protein